MTREEAIKMLGLYEVNDAGEGELETWYNGIDKDMREALDMAIEALTEPINCVKCKHYYETEDDTDVHGHCGMDTVTLNSPISIQAEMVAVVRCNDCKWYQGVHGVQGHAPCEWLNKQVLWNDFCSNGEPYKGGDAI